MLYSLTVPAHPPFAIACFNMCAHVKNPRHWQPNPNRKILHALTGMGGAALAAAVLYLGKATQISRRGQLKQFRFIRCWNPRQKQNKNERTERKDGVFSNEPTTEDEQESLTLALSPSVFKRTSD